MADEFQQYLDQMTEKVHRELSEAIRQEAVKLSEAQKQAASTLIDTSMTGALEESCVVLPGQNDLEWIVSAGGYLTTFTYDRWTDYQSEVVIDGRNNENVKKARKGTGRGVTFDHAVAFEFGTSRQAAKPFFFNTYEARRDEIQAAIEQAVQRAIDE